MPRGIYERSKKQEVVSEETVQPVVEQTVNVPRETIQAQPKKVRKYSDHKGEGEPLCLNCEHRQDMHHTWTYHEEARMVKNPLGEIIPYINKWKEMKIEEGNRPCQHACLCKNYE